ncbi:MAG: polysaccharide deacetylase family protein [bacterium]|jgi:peptidoglycan/xylan/chitin deacetylase (PgdA/CDA1 family)
MLKIKFYYFCKFIGCFHLARWLTRRKLRILCYHGFSICDEHVFWPEVYMDSELFRKRMEYLSQNGYPVLPLEEAIEGLQKGNLTACPTVLTIDDGFYSVMKKALPVLLNLHIPCTVYVTTYYCLKGNPVFRIVVQYMFWKTTETTLSFNGLGVEQTGEICLQDSASKKEAVWKIIDHAENHMDEEQRVLLCQELGKRLAVDYSTIVSTRQFTLMTLEEIREASEAGIDIQLHAHRHRLPVQPELVREEIEQNRKVLEPLTGRMLRHFCYPSGIYSKEHFGPLASVDVSSAVTCEGGLNSTGAETLSLRRFLDGNTISWIEFEAEMSGFTQLLRDGRSWLKQFPLWRKNIIADN